MALSSFEYRTKSKLQMQNLSENDKKQCQRQAQKVVCETGVSMYQFRKLMNTRYGRTIDNDAVHETIKIGERTGWIAWGAPRRFDSQMDEERNIVLTRDGLKFINSPIYKKTINVVLFSLDMSRSGEK